MATVRARKGKRGTTYYAEVCVRGQRHGATFDTRSAAHAWAEQAEQALRAGLALPGTTPPADMPIPEALRKYESAACARARQATQRMYAECVTRMVQHFNDRTLRTLTSQDIAAYRDYRLQHVGPASVLHDLSFLRGLYKTARVEWGIDCTNPCDNVRAPAPPKHRTPLLKPEEIPRLLDACKISASKTLYPYVMLLLNTAMRPSEAATLTWDRVNLQTGILDLTVTKTEPRRVPLTPEMRIMLSDMQKTSTSKWVFLPDGYTFDGGVASYYFRSAFNTACKRAGVSITLYGLRHSAASYLIMGGVDIRTVAEIMGHKNISMTMRYTHFLDAHKLKAIQVLDNVIQQQKSPATVTSPGQDDKV